MKTLSKTPIISIFAAIGILMIVGGVFVLMRPSSDKPATMETISTANNQAKDADSSSAPAVQTTEELLLYLIEEEKLAHDVYTVLYQKYGATVFGNILESETTHQGRVLTLLQARNITDPRSSEVGVFKNQELQTLYDKFIAQGNISVTEAYKVGVAIEEKDIADISAQLATATDQDVIDTLEVLRNGSENHLRAFNKQLSTKNR